MKNRFQRGQALIEYLISLAGVVILAISGLRLFNLALKNQWDTLSFWLRFPNP
jgi:hypothetical protein